MNQLDGYQNTCKDITDSNYKMNTLVSIMFKLRPCLSQYLIYTYIRGNGELIVFLLELLCSCMISSNFHVIAQKYLSVAVNPVKHLKRKM